MYNRPAIENMYKMFTKINILKIIVAFYHKKSMKKYYKVNILWESRQH